MRNSRISRGCAATWGNGKPTWQCWVLANPAVYTAIVGVRAVSQLEGLARAAELSLDQAAMTRLEEIFHIMKGRSLKKGPVPEAFAW